MKGRQLTLEEVLNLEDGTKVWVEELDEAYKDESQVYIKVNKKLVNAKEGFYNMEYDKPFFTPVVLYEWINNNVIKDMATEICNLRGIDLTEDNIDKIMKEFVDKE